MATTKLGDVKIRDIKAALQIEEETLEQIQRIARRQLQRLDVEEEVLQRMLEQLEDPTNTGNHAHSDTDPDIVNNANTSSTEKSKKPRQTQRKKKLTSAPTRHTRRTRASQS